MKQMMMLPLVASALVAVALDAPLLAQDAPADRFEAADVFQLEWASDPQISPDGSQIVYVRNFNDVMTDRSRSNLWIIDFDGSNHRPLTSGNDNYGSPRWSPTGDRLAIRGVDTEGLYNSEVVVSERAESASMTLFEPGSTVQLSLQVETGAWLAFDLQHQGERGQAQLHASEHSPQTFTAVAERLANASDSETAALMQALR